MIVRVEARAKLEQQAARGVTDPSASCHSQEYALNVLSHCTACDRVSQGLDRLRGGYRLDEARGRAWGGLGADPGAVQTRLQQASAPQQLYLDTVD